MRLWPWCVSDKATRSDDDGDDDSVAGPSISKPAPTPAPRTSQVYVQLETEVKRPDDLFEAYADTDNSDVIGPEGLEKLCADADIPMDGARPLLLAWQLDAKEMGSFTREEWRKGLEELKVVNLDALSALLVDLEDLLIFRKPAPKRPSTPSISKGVRPNAALPTIDKYKKARYWQYVEDVESAFLKFYAFCFALAKKEGSRNIDMEIAEAFWSVVLAPVYPIMLEIIEFITHKGTYRAVNKDLWSMMEEFCRTVKPSLEGYDADGAWPTLLDDFVTWKRDKMGIIDGA